MGRLLARHYKGVQKPAPRKEPEKTQDDFTKAQLQEMLDARGKEWKPIENKTVLWDRLMGE